MPPLDTEHNMMDMIPKQIFLQAAMIGMMP